MIMLIFQETSVQLIKKCLSQKKPNSNSSSDVILVGGVVFTKMSLDGVQRIAPQKQSLDEAYSAPGKFK